MKREIQYSLSNPDYWLALCLYVQANEGDECDGIIRDG